MAQASRWLLSEAVKLRFYFSLTLFPSFVGLPYRVCTLQRPSRCPARTAQQRSQPPAPVGRGEPRAPGAGPAPRQNVRPLAEHEGGAVADATAGPGFHGAECGVGFVLSSRCRLEGAGPRRPSPPPPCDCAHSCLTNPEAALVGRSPGTLPCAWRVRPYFFRELCNSIPNASGKRFYLRVGAALSGREKENIRASRTRAPAVAASRGSQT